MSSCILETVLPGQRVGPTIEARLEARAEARAAAKRVPGDQDEPAPVVKLGHGLLQVDSEIVAYRAGALHFHAPNRFFVCGPQKRYVPAVGDLVVGIVTAKMAELYRVDIGCHMGAALPLSGFEGATRKNKPNLAVGSAVLCRVLVANRDLEPELVCFDAQGRAEGYGEIKEAGLLSRTSCTHSQSLQRANCRILEALGKHFSFQVVAGANGRFVVAAEAPHDTILITRAIMQARDLPPDQIPALIKDTMGHK